MLIGDAGGSSAADALHMSEKLTPLVAFNDDHEQLIVAGSDPSSSDED